jgi:hypothetical protein
VEQADEEEPERVDKNLWKKIRGTWSPRSLVKKLFIMMVLITKYREDKT